MAKMNRGLILSLVLPLLSGAKPFRFEVVTNSNDYSLSQGASFLKFQELFPELVDVSVYVAMKKDESTGEYQCVGPNCNDLRAPLDANKILFRGIELTAKPKKLPSFVNCMVVDINGRVCAEIFGVDFSLEKFDTLRGRAQKQFARHARATARMGAEKANLPLVWMNGKKWEEDYSLRTLVAYAQDHLPADQKIPGISITLKSPNDIPLHLTVIESPNRGAARDAGFEAGLLQAFPKMKITAVAADSKAATAIMREAAVASLPAYILPVAQVQKYPQFNWFYQQNFTKTGNYFAQYPARGFILGNKRQEKTAVLVARPLMPETIEMEAAYLQMVSVGKTVPLKVRYFLNKIGDGAITAMGGEAELEEVGRQLLIQERLPEKFWSYVKARNLKPRSSRWDLAAAAAGIDSTFFAKYDDEVAGLIETNYEEVTALKVRKGNLLVWENQVNLGTGTQAIEELAKLAGEKDEGQQAR